MGVLSVVTFLPALGALLILVLVPRRHEAALRWGGLAASLATFVVSLPLWLRFDAGEADMQFEETLAWMPGLGAGYHVGIDGISVLLVLLTTFLMPVALASAWHAIEDRTKEFVIAMLLLEAGMVGVFVSLDLFLFFVTSRGGKLHDLLLDDRELLSDILSTAEPEIARDSMRKLML